MKSFLLLTLDFPPLRGGVARYYDGWLRTHPQGAALTSPHLLSEEFDSKAPYPIFRRELLKSWIWPRWSFAWLSVLAVRRHFSFDRILVGNILPLGYPALLLRAFAGIPYDVCLHGLDILSARRSRWKKFWVNLILSHAGEIIVNSQWTARLISSRPATVVYPRAALPKSAPEDIRRFREQWNLEGKRVILSVSRLVARKGHDMALQALGSIFRDYPDVLYLIIGDGPDRDRLQNLVKTTGLADRVIFTGPLPDMALSAAFASATLFLLPTRSEGADVEGFGLVFLEAAAFGVPSVAGEGGGVSEAVIEGKTGLLVDPRDEQAIAGAIRRLLDNPTLCRQ